LAVVNEVVLMALFRELYRAFANRHDYVPVIGFIIERNLAYFT